MKIKIAQVKVFPAKGKMEQNQALLEQVLADIAPHRPDVVITPEGWLDGYATTEDSVEDMADYAIDPADSPWTRTIADYARANHCWVVYGCTRTAAGSASAEAPACHNSALIYEQAVLRLYAERFLLEVPRDSPSFVDAYRLLHFVQNFVPIFDETVPQISILREFVGGSAFKY